MFKPIRWNTFFRDFLIIQIGFALFGLSIALLIRANLGTSPWVMLEVALAQLAGLTPGTMSIIVGLLVLSGSAIMREQIGWGTLTNILFIGPHIADMRKGKGDDLTGIAGIGQNFLIAGHGGVEANFTGSIGCSANALAPKDPAIAQNQGCGGPIRCFLLGGHLCGVGAVFLTVHGCCGSGRACGGICGHRDRGGQIGAEIKQMPGPRQASTIIK